MYKLPGRLSRMCTKKAYGQDSKANKSNPCYSSDFPPVQSPVLGFLSVQRISHTVHLGKILFLSWDTEDIAKPSFEKIPDESKQLFTHF